MLVNVDPIHDAHDCGIDTGHLGGVGNNGFPGGHIVDQLSRTGSGGVHGDDGGAGIFFMVVDGLDDLHLSADEILVFPGGPDGTDDPCQVHSATSNLSTIAMIVASTALFSV